MKRQKHVMYGYATLALALVTGRADAWGAPSVKGQTTDTKVACDEAIGQNASAQKAWVVGRIGRCLMDRGENVQAAERLQSHLSLMDRGGVQGGRPALEALLKTALSKIGTVDIKTPKDAEVLVDGRVIGTSPDVNHVFVEPGSHVIEARKNGVEGRKDIEAGAGSAEVVLLPLEPKKVELPKPIDITPKVPVWRTPLMIMSGVGAGVGLTIGIASIVTAKNAATSRANFVATFAPGSSKCVNVPGAERCQREAEYVAEEKRASGLAAFGFVLSGIGVATFTTAFLYPRFSSSSTKTGQAFSAMFVPLQGGAGIVVGGDF